MRLSLFVSFCLFFSLLLLLSVYSLVCSCFSLFFLRQILFMSISQSLSVSFLLQLLHLVGFSFSLSLPWSVFVFHYLFLSRLMFLFPSLSVCISAFLSFFLCLFPSFLPFVCFLFFSLLVTISLLLYNLSRVLFHSLSSFVGFYLSLLQFFSLLFSSFCGPRFMIPVFFFIFYGIILSILHIFS